MPVGPSHRRSGGGSHSSFRGSSSSRGGSHSSFGGFGGGVHVHIPRRPIRINLFGSRVVVSTRKQSAIVSMIVILAFLIIGCFFTSTINKNINENLNDSKAFVAQCEIDAVWYETAKQKALEGNDPNFFVATARYIGIQRYYYSYSNPTGYYFDEDMDVRVNNIPYFYLIYEYEVPEDSDGDGFNDIIEGETYSSFSSSQASGWDKKIIVGKDNGSWASINYDYSLSTNQEYLFMKNEIESVEGTKKIVVTIFVVLILASVLMGVGLIFIIKKTIKQGKLEFEKEQQKKDAEIAEAQAKAEEAEKKASQVSRVCAYCGSSVPDGEENCPNCGSAKFE